jgi:hypothetical protein
MLPAYIIQGSVHRALYVVDEALPSSGTIGAITDRLLS